MGSSNVCKIFANLRKGDSDYIPQLHLVLSFLFWFYFFQLNMCSAQNNNNCLIYCRMKLQSVQQANRLNKSRLHVSTFKLYLPVVMMMLMMMMKPSLSISWTIYHFSLFYSRPLYFNCFFLPFFFSALNFQRS